MAQRKQPTAERKGIGTTTGGDLQATFVSALLRADTPEQIAALVLQQAGRFGCRGLHVVWTAADALGRPAERGVFPTTALTGGENHLLQRALAIDASAHSTTAASHLIADVLDLKSAGKAVLLTEWPRAETPSTESDAWRDFIELISARLDSTLQSERQRKTMEGLERSAKLQAALYTIADVAGSSELDMPEMLRHLHEVVGDLMYAENFLIALYSAERDSVRFIYFADTQDSRVVDPEIEYPAAGIRNSLTLAVIRHGRPLMGPSFRLREELGLQIDVSLQQYGPESMDWLGVPMLADGVACGAVVVQSYDATTHYTEEDRALLGFVAQHILTAVVRRQAHEELESRVVQRTRELTTEVRERQRGERLQAALFSIADLAGSELDMYEMLHRIHGAVGELMYAHNFYIALYSQDHDTLRFIYDADEKDPGTTDPNEEIPAERMRNSLTLGLIRHGQPVMGTSREVRARLHVPGDTSMGTPAAHFLGVPMVADAVVRGVIVVQSYDEDIHFDEEDRALLSYVAQHILTALVRKQAKAELEQRVEQRTRELTEQVRERQRGEKLQAALYKIADLAGSGIEMAEMLRRLHAAVAELMYAENFFIALYNPQRDTVRFIYFADLLDPDVIDPEEEIPASEMSGSLSLAVIRHGRSAMGSSWSLRDEFGIDEGERDFGPESSHWLGVPMVTDSEVRGAVVVQSYDAETRYTEDDRALLGFVAQHILTALQRRQAYAELEQRVAERTHELTVEVVERQRGEKLQSALYAIADLASGDLDMSEMLRRIHAIVGELMYAKNFFIALYSAERQTLRFIYHADEKDPGIVDPNEEIPTVKMRNSLTLGLIHYGQPVMGPSREVRELMKVSGGTGVGTPAKDFLGVPMIAEATVRGVVVVQSYDESVHFTIEDRALLSYVAQHILTALARKQAKAELERRVEDRTRELADAVHELRAQIGERERVEQQLLYDNLHDALTGLPNRTFLLDALARALARMRRDGGHRFAVLFLDLDRFKVVNDSVGHLVGDEMLKQAGERIAGCVRAPDVVARLGGDEFAILLDQIHGPEDSFHVAQRVIDSISQPMHIAGKELFPSASVGIALSNERYRSAEELLRDADVAMYRAKARGRQRFEVFDERLHQDALHLLNLESDLRRALLRSEFEPHFQSIVRLADAHIVGCEALLRWRHPERGLLLPADFLAVAEENGSAEQIDWQMFDKTCDALPNLLSGGGYVTLNVSARHFRSPELARQILDMLAAHAVPPGRVRLEMTEGALFENPDQACTTLETLRRAGVYAALDDFGTGYSSLSYLHRFPLHTVKIDKSFVADLRGTTGGSAAVVRAVLALASTLGMEVVAEGVETTQQRDHLIELGCTFGQGFLFSQPRPASNWLTLH
jgi:diguanylate cyclase (GGDEF)-like protein